MRIAVNTRLLIKNKLEGIGWFTFETLKRIVTSHPEHEFIFLFDRKPHPDFIFADNVKPVVLFPQARHPILWYLWFQWSVPLFLKKNKVDLFLSPDGYIPTRCKTPTLNVIHDINFHHYPEGLPLSTRLYYRYYFPRFAHKATHLVTVSQYSKDDMVKSYNVDPHKISVVHNGANAAFKPISEDEKEMVKQKITQGAPYFIFVGALNPRKNVDRLIRAFNAFKEQTNDPHKLVIVGEPMFMTKSIEEALKSIPHKDDVIFTGRLQMDKLTQTMGAATALAFVPYFEGFGIPMVEAMYCHVPIIASNVTSMPEVAGDAAYYVDPFNEEEIAKALRELAENHGLREELTNKAMERKNLFNWELTAQRLYKVIEQMDIGR